MIGKIVLIILLVTCSSIKAQTYEERMTTLETQAHTYFNSSKDSTYFYYAKMHQLAIEEQDYIKAIDNLNDLSVAAGVHYDLDKIKSTIDTLDSLIEKSSVFLDTLPDKGDAQKNYLRYNKGNLSYELEDFDTSQVFFDSIVNNIIQKPGYTSIPDEVAFVSICYSFIAQMNSLQGKFKVADEYYQKNIRLYEDHIPTDTEGLYKVYNLYAQSLYTQKKYDDAKRYWSTTFNYVEENYTENNRNSLVTTGLLLATLYKDIGQIDSALYYFDRLNKYKIKDDPFSNRFLTVKGEVYVTKGQFDKALRAFEEALEVSLPSDRPRMRKKIGDLYIQMGQPDQALKSYQFALQELTTGFDSNDFSKNPEPNEIKQKQLLLGILGAKAKALSNQKNDKDIQSSISAVDLGVKTLDVLKPSFKNHADKLLLIEDAFPFFETGMDAVYQSYKYEQVDTVIDKAFQYSEKSKAVILLDALLGARATKFANIPEDILDKENDLKSRIAYIEKTLNESSDGQNSNEIEDELFSLRQAYALLIHTIEKDYPAYYDLRYNTEVASLVAIQQMLLPEEQLISYFYGNSAIFLIGLTKDSKEFHKVPVDTGLEEQIRTIHQMLGNPKSDVSVLAEQTYSLYENLVLPFLAKDKNKLIIIPDGLLNYIPFGSLNTKSGGIRYLVEDKTIAYANSATLWSELKDRQNKNNSVLAFAPSFEKHLGTTDKKFSNLLPLPHNTKEVEQILLAFKGDSFLNVQATLSNFNTHIPEYGILHLATHAIFDDTSPEYSYLAFTPKAGQESLLYVRDLYNLSLDAGMVTLSACESGIGELKRGEGFLSLARGFFYSGAVSITSTLWKINDASSTNLMGAFYKNLSLGNAKDVALQEAKKTFLESNRQNALSHPYYWSGFIVSGNTAPLVSSINWAWTAVGAVTLAMGGYFYFRKRKTYSKS